MMNIENITSDIAKELLTILSFCEERILNSIPSQTISKLNELAAYSNKDYFIKKNKPLKEQDISKETKEILLEIYHQYIYENNPIERMLEEEN